MSSALIGHRYSGIFNRITIQGTTSTFDRIVQTYQVKNVFTDNGTTLLHIEVKSPSGLIQVILHQKGDDTKNEFIGITKEGVHTFIQFDKNFTRGMCGMSQTYPGNDKAFTGKGYFLAE